MSYYDQKYYQEYYKKHRAKILKRNRERQAKLAALRREAKAKTPDDRIGELLDDARKIASGESNPIIDLDAWNALKARIANERE